ncbi:MAG: hypothetical protein PHO92_05625 [Candidatus Peribacteraceae bacterium]|nr:hypothetical protein [Candidatus Peribacteraceae bacterium]
MRSLSAASVGILLSLVAAVPAAHAWFISDVSRTQMTSRQVVRTAEYLRSLDRRELLENSQRLRSSDAQPSAASQTLRDPVRRVVRPAQTSPEAANKQRTFQSPALSSSAEPSRISKTPVSLETEAFYRNGIKYYIGTGIQKDYGFAFMWLNFALADGHPLAREALIEVARRMNARQLADARERTKLLSSRFLTFQDKREMVIRDRARENDLRKLMVALQRYRNSSNQMQYPVPIREEGREICLLTAATCRDLLDFRAMVPDFILTIPIDPLARAGGNSTQYVALLNDEKKLVLYAPLSEASFVVVHEEEDD